MMGVMSLLRGEKIVVIQLAEIYRHSGGMAVAAADQCISAKAI